MNNPGKIPRDKAEEEGCCYYYYYQSLKGKEEMKEEGAEKTKPVYYH